MEDLYKKTHRKYEKERFGLPEEHPALKECREAAKNLTEARNRFMQEVSSELVKLSLKSRYDEAQSNFREAIKKAEKESPDGGLINTR